MAPLETLVTAVLAFAATNLDDLLLLAVFFGDRRLRRAAIVAGQFLGIGVLTAASAAAALLALAVPPGWPALLGAVPLILGLVQLREALRGGSEEASEDTDDLTRATGAARSQMLGVAGVTIANGADNLGVYIPLFAAEVAAIPIHCLVFALLTGLWCLLGQLLVRHRAVADLSRRFGHLVLPLVLIALGLHILAGARVLLD